MLKPIDIDSICVVQKNSSWKDVDYKINEFLKKRNNKNAAVRTFENKNQLLVAVYNKKQHLIHIKAFSMSYETKSTSQSVTKTFFQDKIASSIKEEIISLSAEDCQYMVKNKACKHDKTIFNLTCGAGLWE